MQDAAMRSVTSVQSRQTLGALQMCAGMLIIPFLDVFAKLLGATHGPFEITFWRFFMQSALMLPFVIMLRLWTVPPGTLVLQAVRGLLLAMATVFFFAALKHLPMAEAIAIFFAQPMILTVLSALILGERLRARRIGAIIAGLIGTLIIVQPTILIFGWPAILPLGSALSMALYMVLTRKLSSDVNPYQMQFLGSVAAMIGLGLIVLAGTVFSLSGATMSMLTEREVMWVVGMGIAATLGHAFIVFAAEKAPANLLAPFQYVEIIGATALGYLVFSDIPARSTVLGVGVIVLSGLYLFHRERVMAARDHGQA
jgi:S-adenosylmethionine uptake transporter